MRNLFFVATFLIAQSFVFAQYFTGVVHYEIKMDVGDMPGAQMLNGLPMSMAMSVKGTKTRVALDMGFIRQNVITDSEKGESIILMDMEKKAAVENFSQQTSNKKSNKEIKWERQKESTTIAGLKCQRYVADFEFEGQKQKQEIWVHEDLKIQKGKYADIMNESNQYSIKGMDGIPLKMSMKVTQGGFLMEMTFVATKIENKSVADSEFVIPEGYTITKMD